MKKVLLISNKVFHYRIPIYNFFYQKFKEQSIEFSLLTNEIQKANGERIEFPFVVEGFDIIKYCKIINKSKPDAIIFFLHLKDHVLWPILFYAKLRKISLIKWGHMLNLKDQHNKVKNIFYDQIHSISDAIIAYTEAEKRFLKPQSLPKVFVASNTLNFYSFPTIILSKDEIKDKYNIPYKNVVLFVARISPIKQLNLLLDMFSDYNFPDTGLVIVGPGMTEDFQKIVNKQANIMYLGAIYDQVQINELYKMANIFCIPGSNGLAVNQAMFWGLPVFTMSSEEHSPEVIYVLPGRNGYIVDTKEELKDKIKYTFENKSHLEQLSINAADDIRKNASIENMFQGFLKAVNFVTDTQRQKQKK